MDAITNLAMDNEATAILLQETHATKSNALGIPGYDFVANTISGIHGIAMFVHSVVSWQHSASSGP